MPVHPVSSRLSCARHTLAHFALPCFLPEETSESILQTTEAFVAWTICIMSMTGSEATLTRPLLPRRSIGYLRVSACKRNEFLRVRRVSVCLARDATNTYIACGWLLLLACASE